MENFNYSKFRGAICVPFCIFNNKINGNIQGINSKLIRANGYTALEVLNDNGTIYRMQLSANGGLVHLYENSGSGWYRTDSLALKSDFIVVNTDAILVEPGVTNIFISHKNIGRSTLDGKFISLIRGNSNLDVSETITATLTHGGDNIKTKVTIRNSGNTQREIKLNLLIIN